MSESDQFWRKVAHVYMDLRNVPSKVRLRRIRRRLHDVYQHQEDCAECKWR